jgi:hypothetical protein
MYLKRITVPRELPSKSTGLTMLSYRWNSVQFSMNEKSLSWNTGHPVLILLVANALHAVGVSNASVSTKTISILMTVVSQLPLLLGERCAGHFGQQFKDWFGRRLVLVCCLGVCVHGGGTLANALGIVTPGNAALLLFVPLIACICLPCLLTFGLIKYPCRGRIEERSKHCNGQTRNY